MTPTIDREILVTRLPRAGNILFEEFDSSPRFLNQPRMHMPRSKTPAGPTTPPSLDSVRFRLPLAAERRLPTTIQHFRAQSRSLRTCSSRASRATITGIAREVRYQPADGLWLGGTFTHWLVITNFMEATFAPNPKVSVMSFFLAHAACC